MVKKGDNPHDSKFKVLQFIEEEYKDFVKIYTDGSKDPDSGKTGYGVYVQNANDKVHKRTSNNLSVYTTEMAAITIALAYAHGQEYSNRSIVILTDSYSSIQSIENNSSTRPDLLNAIHDLAHDIQVRGNKLVIEWVPAHIGIPGNEICDQLAKLALQKYQVDSKLNLSANEFIFIINQKYREKIQQNWEIPLFGTRTLIQQSVKSPLFIRAIDIIQ